MELNWMGGILPGAEGAKVCPQRQPLGARWKEFMNSRRAAGLRGAGWAGGGLPTNATEEALYKHGCFAVFFGKH